MTYPLEMVPQWCGMPTKDHQDGMGGCWGIYHGMVDMKGEEWCKKCEFYKPPEEKE